MQTLLLVLYYALTAYYYIMIAYILMSWIPELRRSKFYGFVSSVTDPYLRIFRGLIVIGMMDLTPIIGLMLYQFGLSALGQVINSL